jgi:hypothetical protein
MRTVRPAKMNFTNLFLRQNDEQTAENVHEIDEEIDSVPEME